MESSASWPRVRPEEVRSFIIRSLETVGTKTEHAKIMAELLVIADYRGHYSYGMNRIGLYGNTYLNPCPITWDVLTHQHLILQMHGFNILHY